MYEEYYYDAWKYYDHAYMYRVKWRGWSVFYYEIIVSAFLMTYL